jgi:hypothetical protein
MSSPLGLLVSWLLEFYSLYPVCVTLFFLTILAGPPNIVVAFVGCYLDTTSVLLISTGNEWIKLMPHLKTLALFCWGKDRGKRASVLITYSQAKVKRTNFEMKLLRLLLQFTDFLWVLCQGGTVLIYLSSSDPLQLQHTLFSWLTFK